MFNKDQFVSDEVRNKLSPLLGTFKYQEKVEDVNNIIEKVLVSIGVYGSAPKFFLKRSLYDSGDGVLKYASFVLSVSKKFKLEIKDIKTSFSIVAGESFFDVFISEFINFFEDYAYYSKLQENLDELNNEFKDLVSSNSLPFSITFALGNGILDISDTHIVVGLYESVIESLSEFALFDALKPRAEAYKSRMLESLYTVGTPVNLLCLKAQFVKDLDFFSRKMKHKLVRKSVRRKSVDQRVGLGYVDTDTWFATVEKIASTPKEVESFTGKEFVVIDNVKPTKPEQESGKTKIIVSFKLSPFDKVSGEPVAVDGIPSFIFMNEQ